MLRTPEKELHAEVDVEGAFSLPISTISISIILTRILKK
jgi:hypothetical protein